MKKVVLLLQNEVDEIEFQVLAKRLLEAGITIESIKESDCKESGMSRAETKVCDEVTDSDRECIGAASGKIVRDSVLYITDSAEQAALLNQKHSPVLGWLHESGDTLPGLTYVMECPDELDEQYLERVYRRFRNIPWDILETERCILRETTVEDVDAFYEIYSRPEIVEFMENLYPTREQEVAYTEDYIEKVYKYFEFGVWTVILRETGEIIGRAGLSVREGYDLPELGFVIGVPWQGRGIATEICSAILQYGEEELGFESVQALVQPENAASVALCKKLGFIESDRVQEGKQEYILLIRDRD